MTGLPFHRFGSPTGPLLVYLHGSPGGSAECAHFDAAAGAAGVRLACLDRDAIDLSLSGEAYFEAVAGAIDTLADGAPYRMVGFSMGGFIALRTAPYLAGRLSGIDLVSAAAPLDAGDFLPDMVGRPVFQMAMRSPDALKRLTRIQGLLTRFLPGLMINGLFNGARGGDRALAADKGFRRWIRSILAETTGPGEAAYLRDVGEYVQPCADRLGAVSAPCVIWHGRLDNWTPPAMAALLAERLPLAGPVRWVDDASHYSTLFAAMPQILGG